MLGCCRHCGRHLELYILLTLPTRCRVLLVHMHGVHVEPFAFPPPSSTAPTAPVPAATYPVPASPAHGLSSTSRSTPNICTPVAPAPPALAVPAPAVPAPATPGAHPPLHHPPLQSAGRSGYVWSREIADEHVWLPMRFLSINACCAATLFPSACRPTGHTIAWYWGHWKILIKCVT